GKCAMQAGLLKEKYVEIASLKAQLSLKEVESTKAIYLCGQIATIEAVEAARAGELGGLKERNTILEGQIAALESATIAKDSEVAKLTQDLSSLQLSCDELSIKASTLEFKKDKLVGQTTCSELCDEVSGYKLFKEQVEAMQDEQGLFDSSTLAVEIGVTAAAIVPFVTSSVNPMPEREDGRRADFITGPNLRTQPTVESLISDPSILTTTIATTVVPNIFATALRSGPEPVHHTLFVDSPSMVKF
nr:hypothetical protein [Tanacetum cinerariifolium]